MKKAKSNKSNKIVFIIAAFMLAGLVLYLSSTRQPKTKILPSKPQEAQQGGQHNWKNYQNTTHQLSFYYPPDWNLITISDTNQTLNLTLKKDDETQEKVSVYEEQILPYYGIDISVQTNPKNLTAREFYLDNFLESARTEAEKEITPLQVVGIEAIEYSEGAAPSSGPSKTVLVTKNGKVYRFTYGAMTHPETHEKYLETFRQLLNQASFN